MRLQTKVEIICWILGALIWAIIAYIYFSEAKITFALIQTILSIGFLMKAIFKYFKARKN